MTNLLDRVVFHGILGRASVSANQAELRFYEWLFSPDPDTEPVLAVKFDGPQFNMDVIAPLLGCEITVVLTKGQAELAELQDYRTVYLHAISVSAI